MRIVLVHQTFDQQMCDAQTSSRGETIRPLLSQVPSPPIAILRVSNRRNVTVKASSVASPPSRVGMTESRVNRKEGFIGDRGIVEGQRLWEIAVPGDAMSFRRRASQQQRKRDEYSSRSLQIRSILPNSRMPVSMMEIRYVRMFVNDRIMSMGMRMRLGYQSLMCMPMMLVVNMRMVVFYRVVAVDVAVAFSNK